MIYNRNRKVFWAKLKTRALKTTSQITQRTCSGEAWFLAPFSILSELLTANKAGKHSFKVSKTNRSGTSPVVHWLRLRAPSAGGVGSTLGQGTRSHMLQLKTPHATTKMSRAATKTRCGQISKYFFKKWQKTNRSAYRLQQEATSSYGLGTWEGSHHRRRTSIGVPGRETSSLYF